MRSRQKIVAVVGATLALLVVPASYVFGSHVFSDVSSSAFYHDSVTALYNASITSGCGGTKYCPGSSVTRGQMAVFLDKIGGLSVGPGGQARPVVDALSVQGTQSYRFFQNVALSGAGATACSGDIPVGPKAADFGNYSIVHRLYATPGGINPEQVNVQLRDVDDAPDTYKICFAHVDGVTALPNGLYKTFGTEMVFNGQRTFR
jgi:hypothetical protein